MLLCSPVLMQALLLYRKQCELSVVRYLALRARLPTDAHCTAVGRKMSSNFHEGNFGACKTATWFPREVHGGTDEPAKTDKSSLVWSLSIGVLAHFATRRLYILIFTRRTHYFQAIPDKSHKYKFVLVQIMHGSILLNCLTTC